MTDEEITATGRESAQAETETTGVEVEGLKAQLGERDTKLGQLQGEIAEKGALIQSQELELTALREANAAAEGRIAELSASLSGATCKYRDITLTANPEVPAEMVTGDTIAEIDASVESAKALVEKVKGSLESSAVATVPVGAPERVSPSWRELSAREKIAFAIGGGKE